MVPFVVPAITTGTSWGKMRSTTVSISMSRAIIHWDSSYSGTAKECLHQRRSGSVRRSWYRTNRCLKHRVLRLQYTSCHGNAPDHFFVVSPPSNLVHSAFYVENGDKAVVLRSSRHVKNADLHLWRTNANHTRPSSEPEAKTVLYTGWEMSWVMGSEWTSLYFPT